MSDILSALHTDHRHIHKLMRLLGQQTALLASGNDPDWDLVIDILNYMAQYPDACHHPREEQIFNHFRQRYKNSDLDETIERLAREHRELPPATIELRNQVESIREGAAILTRDELASSLNDYIAQQHNHIATEENRLFPVVEHRLTADDLKILEATLPEQQDPVFGSVTEQQFEALYRRILEGDEGDEKRP